MRRRAKPVKAKAEARLPVAPKSRKNGAPTVRDLEKHLAEALKREADALKREAEALKRGAEAFDQQTATAEMLHVISSSPTDVQPVFDTIVKNVVRLCDAVYSTVFRMDEGRIDLVAHHNIPPEGLEELRRRYPAPLSVNTGSAQAARERAVVQISDVENDPTVTEDRRRLARIVGYRSQAWVPMLKGDRTLGVIGVSRREAEPFPAQHIGLLQTFAAQAVIAIENVRLFTELEARNRELTESLQQQTATADVLKVISRSAFDLRTVLDTLCESAVRLCDADHAYLFQREGAILRWAASFGHATEVHARISDYFTGRPVPMDRGSITGRAALEARVVQVTDVLADSEYTWSGAQDIGGWRAALGAPLLREEKVVGVIFVAKTVPQPFTDKQVELVTTFADQAVIAIENVRLFTELKARNRDLTATSEILQVISRSPTDAQPVFETIIRSAVGLCEAASGNVYRFDGRLIHHVAQHGMTPEQLEASRRDFPRPPSRGSATGRAILTRTVVHIDIAKDPEYELGGVVQAGFRTLLVVPMLRDDEPIGTIVISRAEDRPFADQQVALLQTFADQAVIAIENVRLFTELEARNAELAEALTQQTATSEVLGVISRSPTDIQPVLDTVVESAARLCEAYDASLLLRRDNRLVMAAHHGPIHDAPAIARALGTIGGYTLSLDRGTIGGRTVLDARTVHIADVQVEAEEFPEASENARRLGFHTMLSVPLMREGVAIGAIQLPRTEVRLFTERQVALLKTFADQAVIAIENVRLFNELQQKNLALTTAHGQVTEALDQQTATSEILRVISGSPTEVQPVFEAIVASAVRLCSATVAGVFRFDGERLEWVANHNSAPGQAVAQEVFGGAPTRDTVAGLTVLDNRVIHIEDARKTELPSLRRFAELLEFRGILGVPMQREGRAIGSIVVCRPDVGFTSKQIELLKTFADQAVIAIENVRLFTELQEKNRALTQAHAQVTESLEQQTATVDILRVIASSPTDLQPVFDMIGQRAEKLCAADVSVVSTFDGKLIHLAALHGMASAGVETTRRVYPMRPDAETVMARTLRQGAVVHVLDVLGDPDYEQKDAAQAGGWRAALGVPMIRGGQVVGAIFVGRMKPGYFAHTQVELLKTFADQAVIAIENVRLFKELESRNAELTESLEQQTATSDVLKVISRSTFDLQPVLQSLMESAVRLCGADKGFIDRQDEDVYRMTVAYGESPEFIEVVKRHPARPGRESATGRVLLEHRVIHIHDAMADPEYHWAEAERGAEVRTILAVPMLREAEVIGVFVIRRTAVRPFTEKQIELVKTFADQAVIAIENVRLFQELRARTAELTRSVEQLTALGEVSRAVSATLDLDTVLNTIVTRANQLAGTDGCSIFEYDEATEAFQLRASRYADPREAAALDPIGRATPIPKGQGLAGRAALRREPVHIPDIAVEGAYDSPVREPLLRAGYHALLGVPLLREEQVIGVLSVSRKTPGDFAPEVVRVLMTFATQSALAIQNARLFREIEEKGRQLEAASRHKSEFLANMSHELRTPLNAILGFNEMILGQIYGEVPADLREPLTDIQHSGKHLLQLINNVLDLSKIEAGRMELALTDYAVSDIVERVRASLQPLAAEKGLAFVATVSADIPLAYGDGGRITQCLMNLAGNALKFTHRGRVELGVELQGDVLVYRVADTGIGIAPDKLESVFAEFRQGDATITSEFGGTGLGLSITKKFVEMHGGRIWVESEVGRGSTFFFAIPVRLTGGSPA